MSRTIVNFWLDALLLMIFVSLVWVTLVLRFVFPPAQQTVNWSLWGLSYENWLNIQFGLMCALATAVLLHLMLHWSWIWGVVSSRLKRADSKKPRADEGVKTLWGVALLIMVLHLLGIGWAVAALCIQRPTP